MERIERSNSVVKDYLSMTPNFTEFNYKEGYYIKIGYNNQNLVITVYNLDALDGRRFESQINLGALYKLNTKFKELKNIKSIYNYVVNFVKENNYKITPEKDALTFKLLFKDYYIQSAEVTILLTNFERNFGNYKHNMEYINILTNEIKRLRESNIFDNLKQENKNLRDELTELKTIISSNKSRI